MAKENFTRTKPHVNVARQRLLQAGLSFAGVQQLLSGYPILNPNDRELVAQIAISAMGDHTSIWVRVAQPHTTEARAGAAMGQLLQGGLKLALVEQLRRGQLILRPDDRELVAQIVISAMNEGGCSAFTRKVIGVSKWPN